MRRKSAIWAAIIGSLAIVISGCAAGTSGLVTAGGAGASVAAKATVAAVGVRGLGGVPADLRRFYDQALNWAPCHPEHSGFQCAALTVPLNYANPNGPTIHLAMNRLPASDAARRAGSLLTNPGGPGGSGVDFVFGAENWATAQLRAHYDIVGMDPRGVGYSRPAVVCAVDAQDTAHLDQNPAPIEQAEVTAQACERTAGDIIPYVGTENAARDMDIARAALGEIKLNYFGVSYGTLLGQFYANKFPGNVGRFVLDSVDSPVSGPEPTQQAVSFADTFKFMVETCLALGHCPMGSSVGQILDRFDTLVRQLESAPRHKDNGTLTADGLVGYVQQQLYNELNWQPLEQELALLFAGDPPTFQDESFPAIFCLTIPQGQRTVAAVLRGAQAAVAAAGHFGRYVEDQWGICAKWPVPSPASAGQPIHAPGTPPMLLVSNTVDPATPLAWAEEVHAALANSALVTNQGGGHGFYFMGSCTHAVVDNFLISGTIPPAGTQCHDRNVGLLGPPTVPITG